MMARTAGPRRRRVHTRPILQMEAVECGAAALGIVLDYYGRRVPLEELRVACGISRDGSKAGSMVRAARHYGLEAQGFRRETAEILAGPFPSIVFWNHNHFVVLEGVTKDRVYLNDPAVGRRHVSRQEFAAAFSGVILVLRPGASFERGGPPRRLLVPLLQRLRSYEPTLAFVGCTGLMLAVPAILVPGATRIFVDDVLIQRFDGWLGPLLIGLVVMFGLNAILTWVQQMTLRLLQRRLAVEQAALFMWQLLSLPMEFFSQRFAGDLANRVNANDRVGTLLTLDLMGAAVSCLTAAIVGVFMVFYSGVLAAIAVTGVAFSVLAVWLVNQPLRDTALRLQADQGKLFAASVSSLQSIETMKATASEDDFFSKWSGYHARAINSEQRLAIYQQIAGLVPSIVSSLTSMSVLGIGALLVVDGSISLGTLIGFQVLLGGFSRPIQGIVEVASKVQQASAELAHIDDVRHYRRDWRFRETPPLPPAANATGGHLVMENVSFGYSPLEAPLIDAFSLDLKPGQWVALVGESGSGKSTIGRLVSGLYETRAGSVRIDGLSLADWGRDRLAHVVASVDQDIHLFQRTLRDNVTMWDTTLPHAKLAAALDDAGLTDAVRRLPRNVDAWIDEGGSNLNSGQRQRIEIARALMQEPAVLVLDEATSALDAVRESEILQALRRRGMTCVVIAHRASTIRDCDEIVVLERGKVVERGSHAALLATEGAYARLLREEASS